jgi:hypothetical protein
MPSVPDQQLWYTDSAIAVDGDGSWRPFTVDGHRAE